ncbi:hypothetical protein GCM10023262_15660 [Bartonella pachyuromydis]|uniref:Uncharacterized protein n=1 Tax=Bartonella pachyuromydis TaxID=931097 RepID=A0ABP8VNZ2_9HYPH
METLDVSLCWSEASSALGSEDACSTSFSIGLIGSIVFSGFVVVLISIKGFAAFARLSQA